MVDSSDHDRLEEARDQLHQMLTEDLLKNVSVLVLVLHLITDTLRSTRRVLER